MRGLIPFLWRLRKPLPEVGQTPSEVVHEENQWRLMRFHPRTEGLAYTTPVLMVPSLINRWYVLDLKPGKSLIEWLVERGYDVWMIDWGAPAAGDRFLTFDEVCDRYLGRAIRKTCRLAGSEQVHLFGYCMGGTLTAIHAAAHPERIASLLQVAAPVDFHDGGVLSQWTRAKRLRTDSMIEAFGNVPWPLMQASFHMLRPTLNLSKAMHVLDRAWDDESLDGFLALETWGNDNVSLPGEFYRTFAERLYRHNELMAGTFTLGGREVSLGAIDCPIMCVTFEDDHIVPWRGAAAMLEAVSSKAKEHLHLRGGHVGAVVSKSAKTRLWPELSRFWETQAQILPSTRRPVSGPDRYHESS
jgi:polyhydroxyalkanoate synthase